MALITDPSVIAFVNQVIRPLTASLAVSAGITPAFAIGALTVSED